MTGPPRGSITGLVKDIDGAPSHDSSVYACSTSGGGCTDTLPDATGLYTLSNLLPGGYSVVAWGTGPGPPTPSQYSVEVVAGQATVQDLVHPIARPIPPGSSVDTQWGTQTSGVPTVILPFPTGLTTTACAAGSVHDQLDQDGRVFAEGEMVLDETTSGPQAVFAADVDNAFSGLATVTLTISGCPTNGTVTFNIDDIDPSGRVLSARDGLPIPDATVRLLRSDSAMGPFDAVADGSLVMSPGNRSNPDTTVATGGFAWDVLPGFYLVHASKTGCVPAPANAPGAYPGTGPEAYPGAVYPGESPATTPILTIPPPALNLELRLDCGGPRAHASKASLSFAETAIGTTSPDQSFTIDNAGAERLHLDLRLAPSTGDAGDFAVTSDCPAAIDPGAHCTANVTFAPRAAGSGRARPKVALTGDGDGPVAVRGRSPAARRDR